MKKNVACILLCCAIIHFFFSQENSLKTIGFFSAESNSSEPKTTQLIQDLYFSHVSILEDYDVVDYRYIPYTNPLPQDIIEPSIAFYITITESSDTWKCALTAILLPQLTIQQKVFEYGSYYQILLDAKNTIILFFNSLSPQSEKLIAPVKNDERNPNSSISLDAFAGTWFGDDFIDKVIILRAGRGFVIYKNGASMNISVEIKNNKIIAKQTSQANASFFPELPRDLALTAAPQTDPLEWVMEAVNENLLVGEKKTLEAVYKDGLAVSVQNIILRTKWTR